MIDFFLSCFLGTIAVVGGVFASFVLLYAAFSIVILGLAGVAILLDAWTERKKRDG